MQSIMMRTSTSTSAVAIRGARAPVPAARFSGVAPRSMKVVMRAEPNQVGALRLRASSPAHLR